MKRLMLMLALLLFASTVSGPANTQVNQSFRINESLKLNEAQTGGGSPDSCADGYVLQCHTECRADGSGFCVPVQVCACVPY